MIWAHATFLPVVSENPARDGLSRDQQMRTSVAQVCYNSRRMMCRLYPLPWRTADGGRLPINPTQDFIKIRTPILPQSLPFVKVLLKRNILVSPRYGDDGSRFADIPLHRSLVLDRLPQARELTMAFSFAPVDLWLGDFYQVYGPEVRARLASGFFWPQGSGALATTVRGESNFQSGNFESDTGVKWVVDLDHIPHFFDYSPWHARFCARAFRWERDSFSLQRFLPPSGDAWRYIPNVGFQGFSRNATSCGGMWAGFRYYEGFPGRIEFSPLAWDEVKDSMYACSRMGTGRKHFPELVIKVFVIRKGCEPPPAEDHHCWEEVREPAKVHYTRDELHWDDLRRAHVVSNIALMWKIVLYHMEKAQRTDFFLDYD